MEKRIAIIDRNKTNVFAIVMLVVVGVVLSWLGCFGSFGADGPMAMVK